MARTGQRVDVKEVREHARGRWLTILENLAGNVLGEALKATLGTHVKCPFHHGANDFRFDGERSKHGSSANTGAAICSCGHWRDGFELLQYANNWDFLPTLIEVARQVGFSVDDEGFLLTHGNSGKVMKPKISPEEQKRRAKEEKERQQRIADENQALRASLQRRWGESIPLTDKESKPAWLYLASRKLSGHQIVESDVARFHPALPYYTEDRELIGHFPAILFKVLDDQWRPATFHRIYITAGGKKLPVTEPKKLASHPSDRTLAGGGIPLFAPDKVLGVAEGIETALAANRGYDIPVWSTVSATLLAKFTPPKGVQQLVIFADKDRSEAGLDAAKELKQRMWDFGIKARIMLPPLEIPEKAKSVDWNDVLITLGRDGFPPPSLAKRAPRSSHSA